MDNKSWFGKIGDWVLLILLYLIVVLLLQVFITIVFWIVTTVKIVRHPGKAYLYIKEVLKSSDRTGCSIVYGNGLLTLSGKSYSMAKKKFPWSIRFKNFVNVASFSNKHCEDANKSDLEDLVQTLWDEYGYRVIRRDARHDQP